MGGQQAVVKALDHGHRQDHKAVLVGLERPAQHVRHVPDHRGLLGNVGSDNGKFIVRHGVYLLYVCILRPFFGGQFFPLLSLSITIFMLCVQCEYALKIDLHHIKPVFAGISGHQPDSNAKAAHMGINWGRQLFAGAPSSSLFLILITLKVILTVPSLLRYNAHVGTES